MKRSSAEGLGKILNRLTPEFSAAPTIEDEGQDFSHEAKTEEIQRSLAEQAAALLSRKQIDQL